MTDVALGASRFTRNKAQPVPSQALQASLQVLRRDLEEEADLGLNQRVSFALQMQMLWCSRLDALHVYRPCSLCLYALGFHLQASCTACLLVLNLCPLRCGSVRGALHKKRHIGRRKFHEPPGAGFGVVEPNIPRCQGPNSLPQVPSWEPEAFIDVTAACKDERAARPFDGQVGGQVPGVFTLRAGGFRWIGQLAGQR